MHWSLRELNCQRSAKNTLSHSTPVYLVRHFKPSVDDGLCYGQSDIPARAIHCAADAQQLQTLLKQLPAEACVFCSPLRRCVTLAADLFPKCSVNFNPLLKELNFGAWEMTPWDAIDRAQLDAWAENYLFFTPPQGESFDDLCQRVKRFVAENITRPTPAIIITHAGVIKAFLYLFGGADLAAAIGYSAPFGSVTRVAIPLVVKNTE
ncbi:MAG: hypothetical protein RL497_2991 [Pseudomonadota bacterium]